MVPPERLQRPFFVCASAFIATLFGLLIWSVKTQGGGGPLFHTEVRPRPSCRLGNDAG